MNATPFPFTPVNVNFTLDKIKPHATIVSIGSCFAENIVSRLLASGFHGVQNPNGILYHPYTISDALQRLDVGYTMTDFFFFDGLYHSWYHHGSFSSAVAEDVLAKVEKSRQMFLKMLRHAQVCFITLSGAVQFYHVPTKRIVANCHKVPGNEFIRSLSSQEMCTASLLCSCRKIREINPSCEIIFTLSPVRHYPGELTLNAISKARLLNAIYAVGEKIDNAFYFPAFEIQMDELRDYRYYADDMLHPSPAAQDIVLRRLLESCFEPEAIAIFDAMERRHRAEAHVSLHNMPPQKGN